MTSELSIFAARLRDYISICEMEPLLLEPSDDPALQAHCDAEFNGMALVLFALQCKQNPSYRRFAQARGIASAEVGHWSEIPAIPTDAFKELELSCLPAAERTRVFHSSGTTRQTPSRHFHNPESLGVYEASLLAWFRARMLPGGAAARANLDLAVLTPAAGQAPHSSLAHMLECVRREFRAAGAAEGFVFGQVDNEGAWGLDFEGVVKTSCAAVEKKRPLLFAGTAFSFVHLLDFLAVRGLTFALPEGSRVMETGGYKNRSRTLPKAALHSLITDLMGVSPSGIFCEYGMSELSSQAYDRVEVAGSRVFRFPPWARARVISPETGREVENGETGILQIIDLANVFSVLAVQTEDLAIRREDAFELLGRSEKTEPRGCSLRAG